ncbi:MAG: AAA family ATPase [Candidatus Abyssubacteria bacterium]
MNKLLAAICGKGGVGKTALAALLAKHVLERGRRKMLLIDADPTMALPGVLGVHVEKTVNSVREDLIRRARSATDADKRDIARTLDYLLMEALIESDGFSLLVMGRPESLGCYCPVNDLLRGAIETLAAHFDVIIIDGEAGVEQISRQVIRSVDIPVIVSDLSVRGLQTASMIKSVLESHKVFRYKRMGLVLNRASDVKNPEAYITHTGLELLGCVPEDPNIANFDMEARPLLQLPADSPAVMAAREILSRL